MAETNTVRKAERPAPKLGPDTFKQLQDLIYEMTGIHFQDNKTYLLESRLLPRLKACRCQTFENYLTFLRFDATGTAKSPSCIQSLPQMKPTFSATKRSWIVS